ncbi:MAG: helix-turn-helix domain-containing protein [Succinivibrio sp.]
MNNILPYPTREKAIDFPFDYYYYDKDNPSFIVPYHYHEFQQFMRVLKGSVTITINSKSQIVNAGECVLIGSNIVHACKPNSLDTEFEAFSFNLRELFDLSEPHYSLVKMIVTHQVEVKQFYKTDEDPELSNTINKLFNMVKSTKFGSTVLMISLILEVFGLAVIHNEYVRYENDVASRFYKHFSKSNYVFRYIYDNYTREISLDDMANSVDLSEKYFCKFFKELTTYRPMEYLNKFRIDVAAIKLVTSNDSINEVAATCGFKDPCYFTKLFKRFMGLSPREYREKQYELGFSA